MRLRDIPKKTGGTRTLAIPAIADRVLQTALTRLWSPLLEEDFSDASFGYRPGRSVSHAIDEIIRLRDAGYKWVVDADIEAFFNEIPHTPLLKLCSRHLPDQRIVALIEQWLTAEMAAPEGHWCSIRGIGMGSPLSPLLANLYLHHFDMTLQSGDHKLIRYADDFLILCRNRYQAEQALDLTDQTLESLALNLNADKTRIRHFDDGFEFLGYQFVHTLGLKNQPRTTLTAPRPSPPKQSAMNTLYLNKQGASVGMKGNRLVIRFDGKVLEEVPARRLQLIMIFGRLNLSTPMLNYCLHEGIRIVFLNQSGLYKGMLDEHTGAALNLLRLQFEQHDNTEARLNIACAMVSAKIHNSTVLLKRYQRNRVNLDCSPQLTALAQLKEKANHANDIQQLMGYEGQAAKTAFSVWPELLSGWGFKGRRKRPAPDPVNALLSFGYTLLFHNVHALLKARGLNPMIGCLHALKPDHAALASDLMEEFRSPIVEQLVLRLLSRGQIIPDEFDRDGDQIRLCDVSRKFFLAEFEARMQTTIKHPRSHREMSYRRCIEEQIDSFLHCLHTPGSPYLGFEVR